MSEHIVKYGLMYIDILKNMWYSQLEDNYIG